MILCVPYQLFWKVMIFNLYYCFSCSGVLCPVPPCDKFLHYTPEGNCCPKCRVGP